MNLPTKITLVRVILIPVFIALFLIDFPYHYLVATGVFILASASDFLDGYLARKLNLVTDLGKFLDPLADKALVCGALILCCNMGNSTFDLIVLIATIIIIIRELMITAFRTIAVSKDIVLAADIWGKIKTMTHSSLEKIKGIGPAKAKKMLRAMSLSEIRKAEVSELVSNCKISESDAKNVYEYYHKK